MSFNLDNRRLDNGTQVPPPPSSLPKVVERETEVTKDTVPPTNNGGTSGSDYFQVTFRVSNGVARMNLVSNFESPPLTHLVFEEPEL
ncbi:hypothetical protein Tco_1478000, partial [Tanacetum coccineum]